MHEADPRFPVERQPLERRRFLQWMGASLALMGLSGCAPRAAERIVPYVEDPEGIVPGKPLVFASATTLSGFARGILVECQMGRPTKIEGNPDHPISLGGSDPFMQASVLDLYDPDRSQTVLFQGGVSTWQAFASETRSALGILQAQEGRGLRLVTETVTSPTLLGQIQRFLSRFPQARWIVHDPLGRENALAGAALAFGEAVDVQYRLDQAAVVLALDADFLFFHPAALRNAREFVSRRRSSQPNRLYVAEPFPSLTGAMADHRLAVKASQVGMLAWEIAQRLGIRLSGGAPPPPSEADAWLTAVLADLKAAGGRSLVAAGLTQPPEVHALVHAINQALGNVGSTLTYSEPVTPVALPQRSELSTLVQEMQAGQVDTLLILGGNPAYTAPGDLAFAEALSRVPRSIRLGTYVDETSQRCRWHLPEAHDLEAWGDARAADGSVTIIQPAIAPLYQGRSAIEVMSLLLGDAQTQGESLVRATWQAARPGGNFEGFWQACLNRGVVAGSAAPIREVSLRPGLSLSIPVESEGLELLFRPDASVWDGRFANNAWLQELPKPLSKLTWDNAAFMSPETARMLGLNDEDEVRLTLGGQEVVAPVWSLPNHAPDTVTVTLGYGREAGGTATGAGYDAYRLRKSTALWQNAGLTVAKTGGRVPLATTQHHQRMEGLDLARTVEVGASMPSPEPLVPLSLYPEFRSEGYAWGMAIDLTACIGCNACVVACQAENNIPVVGKEEVLRNRQMHWLRIDRYYHGEPDAPSTIFQPVPCMHCEKAPCELVCPTEATVHDTEGLNEMVYNRCIGTRYCSNNCPYKVRRFNYYQYADWKTESLKAMRNPEVTVRSRGVMEKCTYCIQRIEAARSDAEGDGRRIRDGEVQTACQSACPTRAIVFGDLNDPASEVNRWKASPLNYGLLDDLNTRPRTTYLARLENPRPELG